MKDGIEIYFLSENQAKEAFIEELCRMVNAAYLPAEKGMWMNDFPRTHMDEMRIFIQQGRLLVAELGGEVVGLVVVQLMVAERMAEFGMLVSALNYQKLGIGTQLIEKVEVWAKEQQLPQLRLELLTPKKWNHPNKEQLKKWYRKIGFRPAHTEPFENRYPEAAEKLKTPCDFTIWLKDI